MSTTAPSRAIVNLGHYAHNLGVVRQLAGANVGIIATVKANAYGHGMITLAQKALAEKVAMLGVATVEEGAELRQAGITAPILVYFQPEAAALAAAVNHGLSITVCDVETARQIGETARRLNKLARIHCMVDTGMGRQGFPLDSALASMEFITRMSRIDIVGLATHFPSADVAEDAFTYGQIRAFRQLLKMAGKMGIPYEMAHAANSAAIVNYPSAAYDAVRPGLMSYGVWPAQDPPARKLLKPVLRWETRVTQVKELPAGSTVGYGRTYTTDVRMIAAILPVGYADGYPHHLSNKADVLMHGRRCPVRGTICMDQVVVDVSHLGEVKAGDVVTLIGEDGSEHITAEELALRAGTIPYEILAGIGPRVHREYTS
jgi:alanine racemase